MSEVPSIDGKQVVSTFQKFGFSVVRIKGSHHIMKKAGHRYILSVPVHKGKTINKGTLHSLIDDAGITVANFIAAMN